MLKQKQLAALIDGGHIAYVCMPDGGRMAVTEEILFNNDLLSGDQITNDAARAIIQIYEAELLRLAKRLDALHPS